MNKIKEINILSNTLNLHGVLVKPVTSEGIGVLFLHGGGHADAKRYKDVQTYLANQGIISLAFSFRGCGNSEGEMTNSTLNDRLIDAESALQGFIKNTGLPENKICIWGSSMGGHIACRLISKHLKIKGLILQSAAAYGLEAESQPFGPDFTEIINKPDNWMSSGAFTDLKKYSNYTLIIYGVDDKVIPEGVKKSYRESASQPQFHEIQGYGHPMLKPSSNAEQKAWLEMLNLATKFILEKEYSGESIHRNKII